MASLKPVSNRPLSIYQNSAWLRGLEDTNKGNRMIMFIHFFCLCLPSLTIKLNFNISKVAYYLGVTARQLFFFQ